MNNNSPLYSSKTFANLIRNFNLLKGVYNMGYSSPSRIQGVALPFLLGKPPRNLIAQAQSGTGKTAAFSIAILSRIDPSIQSVQALILVPTLELAIQIGSVIEKMAQFLPYIKIAYAVRDRTISKRANRVRGQYLSETIVIGTPGTVEDWCFKLRLINLTKLRVCCIDEADYMITIIGFQQTCIDIINRLNRSRCQIMLFSTTYPNNALVFAHAIVPNPVVTTLRNNGQRLANIKHFFMYCHDTIEKYNTIQQIYASVTIGQAIIFCRSRLVALYLAVRMQHQYHAVREITSDLDAEQRQEVIRQFREGKLNALIAINIAARGLDFPDVTLIINYDMPETVKSQPDYDTYLHRTGRCGRFGTPGYVFNLIGSKRDLIIIRSIEEHFNYSIDEITMAEIAELEDIF